ncbi:MAG: hypothetical protein AAF558_13290, partial [Verrucomicrobiota bacterium]
ELIASRVQTNSFTGSPFSASLLKTLGKVGTGKIADQSRSQPPKSLPRKVVGNVFGQQIEASELGVLLDISNSTHEFIHIAVKEINKNFPEATIVLGPGCGIYSRNSGQVLEAQVSETQYWKMKNVEWNAKQWDLKQTGLNQHLFLRKLLSENKTFKRLYKKAKRQNRMYVLNGLNRNGEGFGATVNTVRTAHIGLEFLMERERDAVYWFADFADPMEESKRKGLIAAFKEREIKVYQHCIGPLPADHRRLVFSTETGGELIHKDLAK